MSEPAASPDPRLVAALSLLARSGEVDPAARPDRWDLTQLAGGWSRHIYLLSSRDVTRGYIVRVRPPECLLDTDLGREYELYQHLADAQVPVPAVYGIDLTDDNPFGAAYFVMERAPGDAPVVWRTRDRARLEANWRQDRSLAKDLVAVLAAIHNADISALTFLGPPQRFAGVVAHWRGVYERERLVCDPVVDEALDWVAARPPTTEYTRLVHGDFRIGNTLIDEGRIVTVLDWELAYLGDPRFDVAFAALEYSSGKMFAPASPLMCAVADRRWLFAEYERLTDVRLEPEVMRTYSVLACVMIIAILISGVKRFAGGETTDIRMAWNRFVVPGLRSDIAGLMGW